MCATPKFYTDHFDTLKMLLSWSEGVHGSQWLSGRVFDSRSEGCVFEPHGEHVVHKKKQST